MVAQLLDSSFAAVDIGFRPDEPSCKRGDGVTWRVSGSLVEATRRAVTCERRVLGAMASGQLTWTQNPAAAMFPANNDPVCP